MYSKVCFPWGKFISDYLVWALIGRASTYVAGHLLGQGGRRSESGKGEECGKEKGWWLIGPHQLTATVRWKEVGSYRLMTGRSEECCTEGEDKQKEKKATDTATGEFGGRWKIVWSGGEEEDSGSRWVIGWWQGGSHRNAGSLLKQKHNLNNKIGQTICFLGLVPFPTLALAFFNSNTVH